VPSSNLHAQPKTSNMFLENIGIFRRWRAGVSRPRPDPVVHAGPARPAAVSRVPVGSGMCGSAAQRPSGPPPTRPASRAHPPVRGCDRTSIPACSAEPAQIVHICAGYCRRRLHTITEQNGGSAYGYLTLITSSAVLRSLPMAQRRPTHLCMIMHTHSHGERAHLPRRVRD
jgi:hypothetical protein